MAHRLLVLYRPPADPAQFRDHYARVHLPLVQALPGLRASRHSYDVEGVGEASPFFCVFEAEFDDAAALAAAMRSPEGAAVAADVPNYATGGVQILHYPIPAGEARP